METFLLLGLMIVAFYFLLIRPQQRKQKEHQRMMSELGSGVRVMTNSGVFGTIVHMGDKQAIIEVAPGVEMTVLKQAIMRVVNPSEEEFEYDDAAETLEGEVLTDEVATDVADDLVADDLVAEEISEDVAEDATPDSDTKN